MNIAIALCVFLIVLFVALRWTGRRYLTGKWRAEGVAAATVIAFILGLLSPFSGRHLWSPAPAAPVAVTAPAAPQPVAPTGHDVGSECAKVKAVAPASPAAMGHLDVIGDMVGGHPEGRTTGFTIDKDGTIMVQGWAADGATKTAALAACLLLDGKPQSRATAVYATQRPDVAAAYGAPAMGATGFMLTFDTHGVTRGMHAIGIAAVTTRGPVALSSVDEVIVP